MTRAGFEAMIASALGGWVAERVVFGDVSTGASNDIEKATTIARGMVVSYGMSDTLGPLALGQRESGGFIGATGEPRAYSEAIAEAIDVEVRALIDTGMRQAEEILRAQRSVLEALALQLLEDETIEGDELEQIFLAGAPPTESGTPSELPRYRSRPRVTDLLPLPRLASGLVSSTLDGEPERD